MFEHVVVAVVARVHGSRTACALIVMPRSRSMSIRSRYCARMLPGVDDAGELQHPVGQRRLAVVDVGDDAEVADEGRIGGSGSRHSAAMVPRRPAGAATAAGHAGCVPGRRTLVGVCRSTLVLADRSAGACLCSTAPGRIVRSTPSCETPEAHAWRTSSPRSSGSRPTRRRACATRRSSPRSRRPSGASRAAAAAGDAAAAADRASVAAAARQGRQQGRHPQEPGRQPQVGAGQAGRRL